MNSWPDGCKNKDLDCTKKKKKDRTLNGHTYFQCLSLFLTDRGTEMLIIFFLQVSMTHPLILSRIAAFASLLHNKD